jgi:hypothetical protein
VAGELLFRAPQGMCYVPEHLAGALPIFILSMLLISKGFAPDSIFDRDRRLRRKQPHSLTQSADRALYAKLATALFLKPYGKLLIPRLGT